MFTTFKLNNSTKIEDRQVDKLHKLLDLYADSTRGKWINEINYKEYILYWCHSMTTENGVMGAFSPHKGKRVYLLPPTHSTNNQSKDFWCTLIASTLVHELRHAWQYQNNKILYVICCLPILRNFTLERDADNITDNIGEIGLI